VQKKAGMKALTVNRNKAELTERSGMKSDPFDVVAKHGRFAEQSQQHIDPTEGRIIAVKICSHVLDACIWFSFDPKFKPDDDEPLAVFYSDEIPFICDKTVEQLKEIHQWKLTFGPGARVRQ
jgi:hypothetical protein